MVGIDEILLLTFPLTLLGMISAIVAYYLWQHKQKVGDEASFLHLTLIFILGVLLFFILSIGTLISDSNQQKQVFAIGNLLTWLIFLEITMAYLSAFLNRSRPWEKYFPVVNGLSIAAATLVLLKGDYALDTEELLFYYMTLLVIFVVGINSVKRLSEIIPQVKNEKNRKFLINLRLGFLTGGIVLSYMVVSTFSWFLIKGFTDFSISIDQFDVLDWLVWLNIPFVLVGLFITLKIVREADFEQEVDLIEIMNLLDL